MTTYLTRDGVEITPVIFGTSCLGNLYRVLPYETKLEIVRAWFRAAAKPTIDSAGKYGAGLALESIGRTLRDLAVPSDGITVSVKLGWRRKPLTTPEPTFEPGVWAGLEYDAEQDISYHGIMRCYEEAVELLGGARGIDLVSVHDPDEFLAGGGTVDDILGAYRALFELKKAGRVRGVGIGAKDWHVIRGLYNDIKFDWVMFACAPTILRHPRELREFMHKLEANRVGIIDSALFNGGFLTGGSMLDYRKADPVRDAKLFQKRADYLAVCKDFSVDPAAAAVEFGFRQPGVVAVSLNTSDPARIPMNASYAQHHAPAEFWAELIRRKVIDDEN